MLNMPISKLFYKYHDIINEGILFPSNFTKLILYLLYPFARLLGKTLIELETTETTFNMIIIKDKYFIDTLKGKYITSGTISCRRIHASNQIYREGSKYLNYSDTIPDSC